MVEPKAKKVLKTTKETVVVEKKTTKPVADKVKAEKKTLKTSPSIVKQLFTGRRKNAIARVAVFPGTGNVTINKISLEKYFPRESHRQNILRPFAFTKTLGQFDIYCTVKGGGHTGQSGAILLGVARALTEIDQDLRPVLRQNGLLTRDARVVERKKYGKRKARRSTQFSKR